MLPGVRVLSGQLLAVALSLPLPVRLAAGVRVYGRGAGGCLLTVGGGERGADPVGDDLPVLFVLSLVTVHSIRPTPRPSGVLVDRGRTCS